MNMRLTIPLLVILLVSFLARSIGTTPKTSLLAAKAQAPTEQDLMVWHYYESKTDTPWLLVQKKRIAAENPVSYFGSFEKADFIKAPVRRMRIVCPHNPHRCANIYVAQARGFTSPHLKGTGYEWVNVRDITAHNGPDHGVWARTRNGNKVLICPMLAKALRNNSNAA